MTTPCQEEGCSRVARWSDAVRPEWREIIPPANPDLREEWEREISDIKIHYEYHCDQHHRDHVNQHGEYAVYFCIDKHLSRVLEETSQQVHRCPRVWYPLDPCEDENENARQSE